DITPIDKPVLQELKIDVTDVMKKFHRKYPSRVIVVSTSGFTDDSFEFVNDRAGTFTSRLGSVLCNIELIKERVDGSYDVLSF
ncbi:MAG TPA: hypothetical protein VLH35_04440, partial [Candidatus Acidoferrales bacterium]|nr:hypothetical protein [Candidatus Acidoferrales bacterium]